MKHFIYSIILGLFLVAVSCKKDKVESDFSAISFSIDSLSFDTVFTEKGTATKVFKLYNNSDQSINIKSARMQSANSFFRFNLDGYSESDAKNILILPKDSAFIFMDALIDPNGANSPLVIEDKLILEFDNGTTSLPIIAWGQDANYLRPNLFINGLPPLHLIDSNATWTNEKPYVVFGYAVVDSLYKLTINPGAQIHFHSGAGLWIYKDAHIEAIGTKEEPIVFQGDRLEATYDDIPGQWDRIWINEGSTDNKFEFVEIKNSVYGIQAETLPFSYNLNAPTSSNSLNLNSVLIRNTSGAGLLLRNFQVDISNCVIGNAGQYAVAVTGGGSYDFKHLSIGNYWSESVRETPSVFYTNAYQDGTGTIQVRNIDQISFRNCIVDGAIENEIDYEIVQVGGEGTINANYSANLFKTNSFEKFNSGNFMIYNQDPKYTDAFNGDYSLEAGSPAIDQGVSGVLNTDFNGNTRDANPDLGAFEKQ